MDSLLQANRFACCRRLWTRSIAPCSSYGVSLQSLRTVQSLSPEIYQIPFSHLLYSVAQQRVWWECVCITLPKKRQSLSNLKNNISDNVKISSHTYRIGACYRGFSSQYSLKIPKKINGQKILKQRHQSNSEWDDKNCSQESEIGRLGCKASWSNWRQIRRQTRNHRRTARKNIRMESWSHSSWPLDFNK
jgi:hypothetical protein